MRRDTGPADPALPVRRYRGAPSSARRGWA